jgi:hypothetical protein
VVPLGQKGGGVIYSESQGQKRLSDQLKKEGYLVTKVHSTNRNGFPDLMAIKPGEPPLFIEAKAKNGKRSASQKLMADKLKAHGAVVKLMDVSGPVAIEIFDEPIAVLEDIGF